MIRFLAALALVCAVLCSTGADARPRRHGTCVPVYIEGAGTVRICAPARGR